MTALHLTVLDEIGAEICAGTRAAGSVLTLDEIERVHGVSRSVARETIRVLEALGLVASRRRVGSVVQPESAWNLYDPRIIRWRMSSPAKEAHVRSLTELRLAVEPEAARLAAQRAASQAGAALVGLAARMWAAHENGDAAAFHDADLAFHTEILTSSGNPLFAHLDGLVGEALTGRHVHALAPERPTAASARLHAEVATAIQQRRPDAAAALMRDLLLRSADETEA